MIALQELEAFDVRDSREFSLSQLKGLNQLRGSISISSLYMVRREEATEARLCNKVYLTSLELSWYSLSGSYMARRSAPILEDLVPPSGLRNLRIVAYRNALPSWLSSSVYLTSLQSIHLVNCLFWESIPHPQQLPVLQEMHLISLSRVRKIEVGPLKILELRMLQNLRQFTFFDKAQSYANLQVLEVEGCPKLNESLSQIFMSSSEHKFLGLHRLQIKNDFILRSIPLLEVIVTDSLADIDLRCEQSGFGGLRLKPSGISIGMQIEGNDYIQKLDERLFALNKLMNLQELEIRGYPTMRRQERSWDGFQQLTSLKKFRMIMCTVIFATDLELFLPPSIEELEFSWCNITGIQLSRLLLHLGLLKNLKVDSCEGVISLPVGLFTDEQNLTEEGSWCMPPDCLKTMKSLQISFARGKEDPSSVMFFSCKHGLGRFVSLEKIVIENCLALLSRMVSGEVSHISPSYLAKLSIAGVEDSILHLSQVSSIVDLEVSGCPSLSSLSLNSCTALQKVCVRDCISLQSIEGLESCTALRDLRVTNCELLQWLRSPLSSLKMLAIEKNKSLASLDLSSCTALQKLCIVDCPAVESWEGLKYLISLEDLRVKRSPGFTTSWVSAAEEVSSEHCFSLPLQKLDVDDIGVLCLPICRMLTSLKTLFIDGGRDAQSGNVDILTNGLLLLTSLRHLALEGFVHLQSLPAELQSLKSLKRLQIVKCRCITSLPVGGLPDSLTDLEAYGCSDELNVACREMLRVRKINLSIDGTDEEPLSC